MGKRCKLVALAVVAGAWTLPAQAQMVRGQSPESVAAAVRTAGYAAEIKVDKIGDPMIASTVSGTPFQVMFYNCTDHKECATVQFHIGYDLETPVSLESINEWNRSQRFGRAYLDKENDPILEMDIDLDDGGISTPLFSDNLEFWSSVVTKFEKHIGYRE